MTKASKYGTARWPASSWLYIGRDSRGVRYLHLSLGRFWADLYGWRNLGRCRRGVLSRQKLAAPRPPMEAR